MGDTLNQMWMSLIADSHDIHCKCEAPFAHLLQSIFPPGHKDRQLTIEQITTRDYLQCHSGGIEEESHGIQLGEKRRYFTRKTRRPRYKRRYRRPYTRRRRRRRRKRKVRRKLQKITVKQWQPDSIVRCKIKGFGCLVAGAQGRQPYCYTNSKYEYPQPKAPGGGGFGAELFTLQYLYEEWVARKNIWTKSNDYKDLVRFTGVNFLLF